MKRHHHLLAFALALLSLPLLAAMKQDPHPHDLDETPLMQQMQVLGGGMKGLRRSLRDPEMSVAALEIVLKMQTASQLAKVETPLMTTQVAETERAVFAAGFRREMVKTQQILLELELALLDGDAENAQTIFKRLKAIGEQGHEEFTME